MFGFLKDKLKGALNKFSKGVDEEAETTEEIVEETIEKDLPVEPKENLEPKEEVKKKESKPKEKPKHSKKVEAKVEEKEIEDKTQEISETKDEVLKDSKDLIEEEILEEKNKQDQKAEEKDLKEISKEIKEVPKDKPTKKIEEPVLEEESAVEETPVDVETIEESNITEEELLEEDTAKDVVPVKEDAIEEVPKFEEPIKDTVVEESVDEFEKELELVEEPKEEKKGFFGNLFKKKTVEEPKEEAPVDEEVKEFKEENLDTPKEELESLEKEPVETEVKEVVEEEIEEEKEAGFFEKIASTVTKKKISEEKFEDLFLELEIVLLENNVSLDVVEKIKTDLKKELVDKPIPRSQVAEIILKTLKNSINELFDVPKINILEKVSEKKPLIISFIGVNGSGKTTQLAKLANLLKKEGKTCVMAACDTFRAAAIQQLEEHANNLDIKMIKHDYGADAAAVAYDAIEHAKSKGIDVVLIDTAGRLHSNSNLMAELRKLIRVANPDINIFVGESITGNDCVEQATQFQEAVDIDGIILTKADVDDKGGAAVSISYVTGKPILYLGNGQNYDDLQEFKKEIITSNLGL